MTTKTRTTKEQADTNLIVKMYAGSIAYGTNLPTSDVDFRGMFFADRVNIMTPFYKVDEFADKREEDTKLYELTKFVQLYMDANPNIVELLWTDDQHITHSSPEFDILRSHRAELLSSKVMHTFSGYARSQLKRIKGHNKFINNPKSDQPPKQTDFVKLVQNFTQDKVLPREFHLEKYHNGRLIPFGNNLFGLYPADLHTIASKFTTFDNQFTLNTVFNDESRAEWGAPSLVVKFNVEEYKQAKDDWNSYWSWKKNRNPARGKNEEQFGYDTKHAMHLIRLYRMGQEILETGEVQVFRKDASELLEIRHGKWSYEEVIEWVEYMDKSVLPVAYEKTSLPKRPNVPKAATMLIELYESGWSRE